MNRVFYIIFIYIYLNIVLSSKIGICESVDDCSLNGVCLNSKCVCDNGWKGRHCDLLNLDSVDYNKGYKNESQASWGGNAIYEDGKWHLFVAEMANGCPLNEFGSSSQIIRSESDSPDGPFQHKEIVISHFSHNPTLRKTNDGEFVLYFIGDGGSPTKNCSNTSFYPNEVKGWNKTNQGYETSGIWIAHSKSIYGPWSIYPLFFENPHYPSLINCSFANPSPSFEKNSSKVYLAFTAGFCHEGAEALGIAVADSWRGPYNIITDKPIFKKPFLCLSNMQYEDPFLYKNKRGYHLMIHSMCPSGFWNSAHAYSHDAKNWKLSPLMPYSYIISYKQGGYKLFFRRERPQFILDDDSNPLYLITGVEEWFGRLSYTIITKILK